MFTIPRVRDEMQIERLPQIKKLVIGVFEPLLA
jgi:hypothetical protein